MKLSSKENLALVSLLAIMFLSSAFVLLPKASANTEAVDTITLTIPPFCSISSTVSTAHIGSVPINTYVEGIGETLAKTICNDNTGYAVYAIGYTDDTYGKTVLASNIDSQYDIATGLATSGETSNWAMKLTAVESTYTPTIESDTNGSFSSYHIVPSTYTKVVSYNSSTDQSTGGSFKTTYAVFSSRTQQAGNYEGQVKYTLVNPASHAAPEPPKTIATASTMQEVAECPTSLTTGQVYTIKDSRDNQDYKVAKLADGKCWMVENLNLAGGTAIESTKSDVDASYISSFSTSNNLTKTGDTIVLPASSTSGFDTDNYSYVYNTGNKTSNCSSPGCYSYYSWDAATLGSGRSISTDNTDAPYSICPKGWKLPTTYDGSGTAAEATDFRALMIAYGGSNSVKTYNSISSPTGATMYGKIGPDTTTPGFLLAGTYDNGSFLYGGSDGYYWSSTSYSNTSSARNLFFYSSSVYSASSRSRYYGFSVRCVFGG